MGTQVVATETTTKHDTWLSELARDEARPTYTSQQGEDRILAQIFSEIGVAHSWCVEFGAADGKRGSNTWQFINREGWSSVQIEPKRDADLLLKQKRDTFEALLQRYGDNDRVQCLDVLVGYEGDERLDVILSNTATPIDFDLLSIDIDSEDYRVWEALEKFRPRVVIIEHNKTVPVEIAFASNQGSSLRALVELGKKKGYELVAATDVNGVFVREDYFEQLGIANNDPATLWAGHEKYRNQLWQLYDGTVVINGNQKLRWARGADGTLPGQLSSKQFVWSDSEAMFTKGEQGQARTLITGRLRHWLYKVLDRL